MKVKVCIRADGSPKIGLGHLVRCIALANMLKENYAIHFFCKDITPNEKHEIKDMGFLLTEIEEEAEFLTKITARNVIVLDSYTLDTTYQQQVKEKGCKLVCLDDLYDKTFFADLIINHAPLVTPDDYTAQSYTEFAVGPAYALLRPAFLAAARTSRPVTSPKHIFICFGGSDKENLTERTLKIVQKHPYTEISVVTGESYLYDQKIGQLCVEDHRIKHYKALNAAEILELMIQADVGIVSASGILFELLAAGCKAIAGYYVPNQQKIYEGFLQLGAIFGVEDFREGLLNKAITDTGSLTKTHIIDGLSGERILQLFNKLSNENSSISR